MPARQLCACAALLMAGATSAQAQPYPAKPIRIVVPLAAGGTGDTLARLVAEKLGAAYGQQVVADNRPGANGIIGTELVAKATPDGYTLLSASTGNTAINAGFYGARLPFNVERDLVAVTQIATTTSVVIVFPTFSAKSIKDLISLAKARPGSVNYASAGTGSAVHLGTALFESMAGIKMTHVPYKGSTQGRIAVVSGETDLMFDGLLPSLPLIKAGKLRALGVTAVKRSSVVPDIPTIAETVPGYSADTWYGVFAPHGTPKHIVAKLHDTIARALQTAEMKEKLLAQGAEPSGNTPEQFAAFLKSEIVKWDKVIKDSGAKPE
jgi:tripartite-type tricarboxylate transporter receptor subunit TctC